MQAKPSISIVIPAWNSESQLKQNLPAVFAAAGAVDAQIIVVDDHSMVDNTTTYLESLDHSLTLVKNHSNLGFAATVNIGVAAAKSDIVILLNTDVRPEPDCFIHLPKNFENPKLFAVTFNSGSGWAKGVWDHGLFHHLSQVPNSSLSKAKTSSLYASGGQAAFDKNKWLSLGGMDRLYVPFYWEDVDLGYRAWKRGWKIVHDPRARVTHDHQSSVIKGSFTQENISSTAQRNQLLFIWKNITDRALMTSHLKHLPRYIKNYPKAFFAALARLPLALRGRAVEQRAAVRTDSEILKIWS